MLFWRLQRETSHHREVEDHHHHQFLGALGDLALLSLCNKTCIVFVTTLFKNCKSFQDLYTILFQVLCNKIFTFVRSRANYGRKFFEKFFWKFFLRKNLSGVLHKQGFEGSGIEAHTGGSGSVSDLRRDRTWITRISVNTTLFLPFLQYRCSMWNSGNFGKIFCEKFFGASLRA